MTTKEIKLHSGETALVSSEDYDDLLRYRWYVSPAGNLKYVARWDNETKRPVYMHRQIMGFPTKPLIVDHIDHNGLNNTRDNLRVVTKRGNQLNNRFEGVWQIRNGNWVAAVSHHNKARHLGSFKTKEAALECRKNALQAELLSETVVGWDDKRKVA